MKSIFKSNIWLVLLGVGLGLLARMTLGSPENSNFLPRVFQSPMESVEIPEPAKESIDLPLAAQSSQGSEAGLVPPIRIPNLEAKSGMLDRQNMMASVEKMFDNFAHDHKAIFEAHGEELCASGCAASRHPTEELDTDYFHELLIKFATQPLNETSAALEELLYFGPQTRKMIEQHGFSPLDTSRASLLWDELQVTHAKISIRVVDENGEIRTWLDPTLIPFDRRHVFEMETKNLQPLVTSGTAKRVGLNHIWVRL